MRENLIACLDCDLLQHIPSLPPGGKARCSRCGLILATETTDSLDRALALTFTAAIVQLQPLMSVQPGPGVAFFAGVVVLTMIAAESFDPRLIWDSASRRMESHG